MTMNWNGTNRRARLAAVVTLCGLLAGAALVIGLRPDAAVAQRDRSGRDTSGAGGRDDRAVEGMGLLRECYTRLAAPPGTDSVCSFTCRVTASIPGPDGPIETVEDVSYVMGAGRLEIRSAQFSAWRDSLDAFTLIPSAKRLFRADARATSGGSIAGDEIVKLRDSLLSRSQIAGCRDSSGPDGVRFTVILLRPDPVARRYFGLEELELAVDRSRGEIRTIMMKPVDASRFTHLVWTFSPLTYAQMPDSLRGPVARQFVAENGRTLPAWGRYKLVDLRNTAHLDRSESR